MPLSRDPSARRVQLANLRSAPPAPVGNRRTVRHGGTAQVVTARLDEKVREVFDALAIDAPCVTRTVACRRPTRCRSGCSPSVSVASPTDHAPA